MGFSAGNTDTEIVEHICALNWAKLSKDSLIDTAWAYYYFSIQFRENLQVARKVYPDDAHLSELETEECNTANLSPWRGVAAEGERMDHDEFMRRALALGSIKPERCAALCAHGQTYLAAVRGNDPVSRALSIVSYEGGGLERVFRAMLTAREWGDPLLGAFRHFLGRHLQLDDHHGALVEHLSAGQRAAPLWKLFNELLLNCVPDLVARTEACNPDSHVRVAAAASDLRGGAPLHVALAVQAL
ncbi:MAG: hypothetical protein ACREHV_12120 [Rhizomicrobium sp.]